MKLLLEQTETTSFNALIKITNSALRIHSIYVGISVEWNDVTEGICR